METDDSSDSPVLTPLKPQVCLPFFEEVRCCDQCRSQLCATFAAVPSRECDMCGTPTPSSVDMLVGYHHCEACDWRLCCMCNQAGCVMSAISVSSQALPSQAPATAAATNSWVDTQDGTFNRATQVDRGILCHEIRQLRHSIDVLTRENAAVKADAAEREKEREAEHAREESDAEKAPQVREEMEDRSSSRSGGSKVDTESRANCSMCQEKQFEIERLRRRISRSSDNGLEESAATLRLATSEVEKTTGDDSELRRQLDALHEMFANSTRDNALLESQLRSARIEIEMNRTKAEERTIELEHDLDRLLVDLSKVHCSDLYKPLTADTWAQTDEVRVWKPKVKDGESRSLIVYEVISERGVAYRRSYGNLLDRVVDILGPVKGETVAAQEVRSDWIYTVDGFWLPTIVDGNVAIVRMGEAVKEKVLGVDKFQSMWRHYSKW